MNQTSRRQIHEKTDDGIEPGLLINLYYKLTSDKWLQPEWTLY